MTKNMVNLRETYKWLNDFYCKTLTPPPCSNRYIEICPVDEVRYHNIDVNFFQLAIYSLSKRTKLE